MSKTRKFRKKDERARKYIQIRKFEQKKPNIPTVNVLKDYYISTRGRLAKESPTEKIIRLVLNRYKIQFFSEVSFRGFGYASSPYRFDFFLPSYRTVIEYDGQHHSTTHVKENDTLKNKFCRVNNIKIFRFNKKHYPNLKHHVENLVKFLTK